MTEGEARAELESMCASDVAPTLSAAEIDACLVRSRRTDVYGLVYTDASWTPTWDLNAGAAHGWRLKAAKVAAEFSFSTDGQSFNRSEQVKAFMDLAAMYRNRIAGSVPLVDSTVSAWDTDVAGNS